MKWVKMVFLIKYIIRLLQLKFLPIIDMNMGLECLKFIYSEKATTFCEIFILLLTGTKHIGQKKRWRFRKILWLSQNVWTLEGSQNVKVTRILGGKIGLKLSGCLLLTEVYKTWSPVKIFWFNMCVQLRILVDEKFFSLVLIKFCLIFCKESGSLSHLQTPDLLGW